jgi:hypothetical protein
MKIDLNDIPIGIAETEFELNRLKSSKICKDISNINNGRNYLIVPMSVYNILECHSLFIGSRIDNPTSIFKVGEIMGFDVYVDLYLKNEIILSTDKQQMRENKINSILENTELINDISIDIIF